MRKRISSLAKQDFILLFFIFAFALFFSILAVRQHQTFQTNGLDLGNVDQALWNTAQGRLLQFTLMLPVESRLALHVEPVLLLLAQLYRLSLGSPTILLIIQACVVAVGAWPLYQISRVVFLPDSSPKPHHTNNRLSRFLPFMLLIFPLAYLLLPTLQSAVLFDFHAVTLASTFFLFAFLALLQKKDRLFIIFLILAIACKEDMPLVAAMLGLYAGLAQRRWKLAGWVMGLSMLWFVVAVFVIQPQFAPAGNIQLDRYAWLGSSPAEMVKTLITQPGLVLDHLWNQANLPRYLGQLFFPTAFLAVFSPLTLLPMLPTLAINLLSDNPFTWRLEDFHYGAPLAPFLFISTIFGIKYLCRFISARAPKVSPLQLCYFALSLLLIFSGLYHYYRGFSPLARPFIWPQVTEHHQQLEKILAGVPSYEPMFAQSNLVPHVTQRQFVYSDFAYFTNPDYPATIPANALVLDITGFENIGGLHQFLRQELVQSGNYKIAVAKDGILHLQPRVCDTSLPDSFYTFAQAQPSPVYPLAVNFGDAIRLHGYTLHFNRQEEVQVAVDLEPLQPLPPNIQPVLYLLDAAGQPLGATTDLQPTLVWLPPDQWRMGQTVRVHFNTLPWYTRETNSYKLALGVVSGADVWAMEQRHRPSVTPSAEFVTRLPADGTLVELAHIEHVWGMPEGGPVKRQYNTPRMPHELTANFDDQLKLLGYTAPQIKDQTLAIDLSWQAVTTPPNLTRFVQLVGPDGQVYGQNDAVVDNNSGGYPTYLWQPGEVVQETVTFPITSERPAGTYTLHIGLYRPENGQRLALTTGGDHVEIVIE